MIQDKKLISVIVTAYNIENYLPRCMDSLLKQTYPNLEVILVDDGSTDNTAQICDEYAAKNDHIQVIHQKNGGPSAARNAGLKKAHGAYIGYVDGDDWIQPDMYENMHRACEDTGAQIAICTYRRVGEGAEEIHPTGNVVELSREEALDIYICDHPQYHIYHSVWSKLFKKSVVEDITFAEGRKSEDIMYTTNALIKASKCVFLDTPYYNYVVDRSSSIMNSRLHERRFGDEIPFWKEQIDFLKEKGFERLSEKASYHFYRRMLFYYEDFRDKKMKFSAQEMAKYLRSEKENIREIYKQDFAFTGDIVRMRFFLFSPGLFYYVVKLYEQFVIPLRQ